jgi:hypothetical protein
MHSTVHTLNIQTTVRKNPHQHKAASDKVSVTLLVQLSTQGNDDALTAGCCGPARLQGKAAIIYFFNSILQFISFLKSKY